MAEEYDPILYFSKHINNPRRGAGKHEEISLAAIDDTISVSEFDSQFPDDNKPFMEHQWLQKSFCNLKSAAPAASTPLQTQNVEKRVYRLKNGCSRTQNPPAAMANLSGAETSNTKSARSAGISRDSIRQSAVGQTDHKRPSKPRDSTKQSAVGNTDHNRPRSSKLPEKKNTDHNRPRPSKLPEKRIRRLILSSDDDEDE